VLGYALIALALVVFVQCKNVYPQLLLGRLLFSFGGAAASTMVTAVLPTMSAEVESDDANRRAGGPSQDEDVDGSAQNQGISHGVSSAHMPSVSISSEVTITPALYQSDSARAIEDADTDPKSTIDTAASSSRIAGYVGMFAGCGALLALILFLPLPERFQKRDYSAETSLRSSYYIVAAVAILIALWCLVGLSGLQEDGVKPISIFSRLRRSQSAAKSRDFEKPKHVWTNFLTATSLSFKRADIGLGYVGGFVARASSVGISLFVPLLVNAHFHSSGICGNSTGDDIGGLPDLKKKCSQAYILAAELTGVSQLVALLCAPIFGYASARLGKRQTPLIFASVSGILGYILLATRFRVDANHQKGSAEAFLSMCLIGISQIGAIVCSLGILSGGVLKQNGAQIPPTSQDDDREHQPQTDEQAPLLSKTEPGRSRNLASLKGSIAGVYSLFGGAGILILTKIGGLLFDRVSFGAPFYIMAIFNGLLLLVCIGVTSLSMLKTKERG
jgi:MFS family permease